LSGRAFAKKRRYCLLGAYLVCVLKNQSFVKPQEGVAPGSVGWELFLLMSNVKISEILAFKICPFIVNARSFEGAANKHAFGLMGSQIFF